MNMVFSNRDYNLIIRDMKWKMSAMVGRDIGTPTTVDLIMNALEMSDNCRFAQYSTLRNKIIQEYLFSETYDDADGRGGSRWLGELQRYFAQKRGVHPNQIEMTTMLKREWCKENGISLKD